ncbi:hypothetical protein [Lentzea sp.]|nr:hypothetical protein [Lentzea sp.]HUQ58573.1 hypothetical protein [Lentzea sp.]
MQTQVWVAVLSLTGVVLGGGLSFLVQAAEHAAARHEMSQSPA